MIKKNLSTGALLDDVPVIALLYKKELGISDVILHCTRMI
jgi:hypothetical protein